MKCQYCDAVIKDGVLYCDACGQLVEYASNDAGAINEFWGGANEKKKEEMIQELAGLKGKSEQIQHDIAKYKKMKSKRRFFRLMLAFFALIVAGFAFSAYKTYETEGLSQAFIKICVTYSLILAVQLIFLAFYSIISDAGFFAVFYILIPGLGFLYFFICIIIGIVHMFKPLDTKETAEFKTLKNKETEFRLLKQDEKNLRAGIFLVDKEILQSGKFQSLRSPMVVGKKGINGWDIACVFAIIFFVILMIISSDAAQWILDSVFASEFYEMSYLCHFIGMGIRR